MIVEHDAAQPNTLTSSEGEFDKVTLHEQAAHEKKNWVRLTYDCNNHCIFCLDTLAHDGTLRSSMDVKVQIIEGRKKGASRLILSGGEPTMHPSFLEFVKLGKRAGYRKVQTVTNGRMFSYPEFLRTAAENGLDEITFSLHGHTAKLHDALVGTPGAFEQEVAGLKAALASGSFIVNLDIVINKLNVKHLPEMIETFLAWGVREFDLLQIIPFGNAWGPRKQHLFYDLEGNEEPLRRAMEYSRRPDVHIWLNRFPPPYTEGFEELIQDPYKLNDEVRGRRDEYDRYLTSGEKLSCREPERCRYCYLRDLCDTLERVIDERGRDMPDVLRIAAPAPLATKLPRARAAHVLATSLETAMPLVAELELQALWLELDDYRGLEQTIAGGRVFGHVLERCYVHAPEQLEQLLAISEPFDVVAYANKTMAPLIARLAATSPRLIVAQPRYARVTDQLCHDLADLSAFCRELPAETRVEQIPACISGRPPAREPTRLDAAMLGADARLDMGKYTERYIADRYFTKSRRCAGCKHDRVCPGVHINFVRAHRYSVLKPVT